LIEFFSAVKNYLTSLDVQLLSAIKEAFAG